MNAFVASLPTARSTLWCGSKLVVKRPARGYTPPTRRTPTLCLAAAPKDAAEEEVLDEKAMRAAEIHEVLSGLENFKMRIIEDATRVAKKVRAPKKQLEAALDQHPDILKIDGHIAQLKQELEELGDR